MFKSFCFLYIIFFSLKEEEFNYYGKSVLQHQVFN